MAILHNDSWVRPSKLELLTAWVGSQRWYAAQGASPQLTALAAWRLGDPAGEVGIETHLVLDTAGSRPVVYQVPLTYRGAPLVGAEHALVGECDHGVLGCRWVYDAPHDPIYAACLLDLIQGRARAESSSTPDAYDDRFTGEQAPTWTGELVVRGSRVLSGEQSNTSIILDAESADGVARPVIVKVFRTLGDGDNPDVVLQSALRRDGCDRVPAVLGSVRGQWPTSSEAGAPTAGGQLAFAQEFLAGTEDAWRAFSRAVREGRDVQQWARELGQATAHVHTALARALGSEPTTAEAAAAAVAQMRARHREATTLVPALTRHTDALESVFAAALAVSWPPRQRVHGDYHLGQVLHSAERGWVLLDFEGEPLRPLAERSQPDQWLRDVAGMLRSLDYCAGAAEFDGVPATRAWGEAARAAFLDGYAVSGPDPRAHPEVLAAFEIDKAMYEVAYESSHRPDWMRIPLAAIDRLAHSVPAVSKENP